MARKFNIGRQSEQMYNEELYRLSKLIEHIGTTPDNPDDVPHTDYDGSLWLDKAEQALKYYDQHSNEWKEVFGHVLQLTKHLIDDQRPEDPKNGQLYIEDGVLLFYDNHQWRPIKSIPVDEQHDSPVHQILGGFMDFMNLSPLLGKGNTVIKDEIEHTQFLVPDAKSGRCYKGHEHLFLTSDNLDNQLSFSLEKTLVDEERISFVHLNPARLASLNKTLIKYNPHDRTIYRDYDKVELYGFEPGQDAADDFGNFLRKGIDYTNDPITNNIVLPEESIYAYYVIIEPEFAETKRRGSLGIEHRDIINQNSDPFQPYYIGDVTWPMSIFAQGYNLEKASYRFDHESQTLQLKNSEGIEIKGTELESYEYGIIRYVAADGHALIQPLHQYKEPLIFINGQALNKSIDELIVEVETYDTEAKKTIYYKIPGAHIGMTYSIMELEKDGENFFITSGQVHGDPVISIPEGKRHYFLDGEGQQTPDALENILVFVNGLLVNLDEAQYDWGEIVGIEHLMQGDEFVVIYDDHTQSALQESVENYIAIPTKRFNESLIFCDQKLICNDSVVKVSSREQVKKMTPGQIIMTYDEIDEETGLPMFYCYKRTLLAESTKIFDWFPMSEEEIRDASPIFSSYMNAINCIIFSKEKMHKKEVLLYTYRYAHNVEKPAQIGNVEFWPGRRTTVRMEPGHNYVPNKNTLSVYLNGLRMPPYKNNLGTIREIEEPAIERIVLDDPHHNQEALLLETGQFQILDYDKLDMPVRREFKRIESLSDDIEVTPYIFDAEAFDTEGQSERLIVQKLVDPNRGHYQITEAYHIRMSVIDSEGENPRREFRLEFDNDQWEAGDQLLIWIIQDGFLELYTQKRIENISSKEAIDVSARYLAQRKGTVEYIYEPLEPGRDMSYRYEILTAQNADYKNPNVFTTQNIRLNEGTVTAFIDGLRIPQSAYTVLNEREIVFKDEVQSTYQHTMEFQNEAHRIGTLLNNPKLIDTYALQLDNRSLWRIKNIRRVGNEYITDWEEEKINKIYYPENDLFLRRREYNEILVEVRQDYTIKEAVIYVDQPGLREFPIKGGTVLDELIPYEGVLPKSLLESKDLIRIYIDGLFVGDDYFINKARDSIVLTNMDITARIGQNNLAQAFRLDERLKKDWERKHGKEYVEEKVKTQIIFEWR